MYTRSRFQSRKSPSRHSPSNHVFLTNYAIFPSDLHRPGPRQFRPQVERGARPAQVGADGDDPEAGEQREVGEGRHTGTLPEDEEGVGSKVSVKGSY